MDIYLIRHLPPLEMEGRAYGQLDVKYRKDLLESSVEHLQTILPKDFTCYTSPLTRCKELAEALHPAPIQDTRILELNFGDWEGLLWEEMPKEPFDRWMNDYVNTAPPNGESFMDQKTRVENFWKEITNPSNKSKEQSKPIAVVCHGGVIRSLLKITLEIPFDKVFNVEVTFGGISKITIKSEKLLWEYLNK